MASAGAFSRVTARPGRRSAGCGAQARQADQLGHVLQQVVVTGAFGGDQHAGQAVVGGGHQTRFGVVHGEDAEAVLLQLGDAAPVTGDCRP
jgi:hypothetical protein